jgi:hypothetical protein
VLSEVEPAIASVAPVGEKLLAVGGQYETRPQLAPCRSIPLGPRSKRVMAYWEPPEPPSE